jgi:hypothetical protein
LRERAEPDEEEEKKSPEEVAEAMGYAELSIMEV